MKFTKIPDDLCDSYFEQLVSEDGEVHIAVYPVIFGWRVRAWRKSEACCALDWCCGDNQGDVERLYAMLVNILSARDSTSPTVFNGLPPVSKIKPYFNDDEFVKQLIGLLTAPYNPVVLRNLNYLRALLKASYTAIVLDEESREVLKKLNKPEFANWELQCDHLTLHLGPPDEQEYLLLDSVCSMTVDALGTSALAVAGRVKECVCGNDQIKSKNKIPHITIAVNRMEGGRPCNSNQITNWVPIEEIKLTGTLKAVSN